MTDIDRLTVAVVCGLLLLFSRLPEQSGDDWGLPRLTGFILLTTLLLGLMCWALFGALGVIR